MGARRWMMAAAFALFEAAMAWAGEEPKAEEPKVEEPKAEEAKPAGVTYRGKPRTEDWFQRAYAAFRNKVAKIEGIYVDVSCPDRCAAKLRPGEAARVNGRIVRVLGPRVYLLQLAHWRPRESEFGAPNEFTADSQVVQFEALEECNREQWSGYVAAIGTAKVGERTVVLCQRIREQHKTQPISEDDFREALNSGFELVRWTLEPKVLRKGGWVIQGGRRTYLNDISVTRWVRQVAD